MSAIEFAVRAIEVAGIVVMMVVVSFFAEAKYRRSEIDRSAHSMYFACALTFLGGGSAVIANAMTGAIGYGAYVFAGFVAVASAIALSLLPPLVRELRERKKEETP